VIGTLSSSTLSTDSLSIHTTRLTASATVIHSGPVTVRLPPGFIGTSVGSGVSGKAPGVGRMSVTGVTDCYEATVVLAKSSPYVYGLTDSGRVITLVLSTLIIYMCLQCIDAVGLAAGRASGL